MGAGWHGTEVGTVAGTSACTDCNACGNCQIGIGNVIICVGIGGAELKTCGASRSADTRGAETPHADADAVVLRVD